MLDNDSFNYPQLKVEGYGDDIIMEITVLN